MKSFKNFITEQAAYIVETAISGTGMKAERHTKQYITPYLPGEKKHSKEGTHTVAGEVKGLNSGDKVMIHSHHIVTDAKGKDTHHVTVSKPGSRSKITIPTSKLLKPTARRNRGFEQESALANHLNKHGLMEGGGAGFTGGNDFHLIDKRGTKNKKILGTEGHSADGIQGEHKSDIKTTAFGQITLSRHPETGRWHIDDKARAKRPEYAQHVENATITVNGKKKSLLDHLNETEPHGTSNKSGIYSDHTSTAPAHAYLRDHHVDVLHIDSHGTYRAGMSAEHDRHKVGLPSLTGEGRFRVRQKTDNPNKRTAQFSITQLEKSNIHLGNEDHVAQLKKKLGH
jgi:hypothetical protein